MRLRTTLFALLLVVAVVLSGTVYAGFALHKDDIQASETDRLELSAETVAENIDSLLVEYGQLLEFVGNDQVFVEHGTDVQQLRLEQFVDGTGLDGASVVDRTGQLRAITTGDLTDSERGELLLQDMTDREYVRQALDGNTYISDALAAETGNDIVVIAAPIDHDGEILGVLTGSIHLDATTFFEPTHSALDDTEVVTVEGSETLYQSGPSPTDPIAASASVSETGWTVAVERDRGALERQLQQVTLVQAGAVFLTLLSIAAVGLWVSRTTFRSLDELIDGLGSLQRGEYDTELDLGGTDEWRRIDAQFDDLATALDQRDAQLRVLNRVLRHNLRNDMSVVIAHADSILHSDADEETKAKVRQTKRTAEDLVETSEHARAIYEEMLGDHDRDLTPTDVVATVERELVYLRSMYPESTIRTRLPESAWTLDRETLPLVVEELCRNALAHNDKPVEERELFVTVSTDEKMVRLAVSDNGPGLPALEAELLDGIREPTSIEHGSGLGLWVVSWLVDRLDGSISVTDHDGRGTTITAVLPRALDPSEVVPE